MSRRSSLSPETALALIPGLPRQRQLSAMNGGLSNEVWRVDTPNDRYLLNERRFRLYYTSQSADDSQTIDLYFEDNWGNMRQLTYGFNVNDAENNVPGNE